MSIQRTCRKCFQTEANRYNFGSDREAERKFHAEDWCTCGYTSSMEMMKDQDLGFDDPRWVRLAKYFIETYHRGLSEGEIKSKDELVRFFLKLLKDSANNIGQSIEIVELKEGEEYESIYNGQAKATPKTDIFEGELGGLKIGRRPTD